MDRLSRRNFFFGSVPMTSFFICAVAFAAGCIFGASAGCSASPEGDVLRSLAELSPQSGQTLLIRLASSVKYAVTAIVLGFSPLGVVSLPLVASVRGVTFSYSATVIARAFSEKFIFAPAIMAENLITVPCFLILSAQSLSTSGSMLRQLRGHYVTGRRYGTGYFKRAVILLLLTAASSTVSYFLYPAIAGLIS